MKESGIYVCEDLGSFGEMCKEVFNTKSKR